jgi:hypothetical protein
MIRGRGASTRRIGLFAKDTILWPFPRFSQAAVANTHLPVYRTYADKSASGEVLNDLFLNTTQITFTNAEGKELRIRFRLFSSFRLTWTAPDCSFQTTIWERI